MPPPAELPQPPQINQRYMANAFAKGAVAPPELAMSDMSANAFGPDPSAAANSGSAFYQGMTNGRAAMASGFMPPGYVTMGPAQGLSSRRDSLFLLFAGGVQAV